MVRLERRTRDTVAQRRRLLNETSSTRNELFAAGFAGAAAASCLGVLAILGLSIGAVEHHPSLWWLAPIALILSSLIWFLQTQTVQRDEGLRLFATRIGTAGYDRGVLITILAANAVCVLCARDWLPAGLLALVAVFSLHMVRQEPEIERGIPDLLPAPTPPDETPRPGPTPGENDSAGGETETRTFQWEAIITEDERANLQMTLNILLDRLRKFREKNPYKDAGQARWPDFTEFIRRGVTAELMEAATIIRKYTDDRQWTAFHEVCATLALAQSIPYSYDRESRGVEEYWRYPIETLYDQTGDCEDSSILAACILMTLGHDVVALLMPAHAAIGVRAGEGFPPSERLVSGVYYFCETTKEGWRVGQVPADINLAEIEVHRLG